MKSIVFTIALLFVFKVGAQIQNTGFELLDPSGKPKNWGKAFLSSFWIDSAGVTHTDSIVIDNELYAVSTDAHTGTYALELRNGYNYSTNTEIAGGAFLIDEVPGSYPFPQAFPITPSSPASFTFWYKYYPVMGDSAMVLLTGFDSDGNVIATATAIIRDLTENYTLMVAPMVYAAPGQVTAVSIEIENAVPGTSAHFGTRFLIDDLSLGNDALNVNETTTRELAVVPNPAYSSFQLGDFKGTLSSVKAVDLQGRQVPLQIENQQVDCRSLNNGTYILLIETTKESYVTKLVVRNE